VLVVGYSLSRGGSEQGHKTTPEGRALDPFSSRPPGCRCLSLAPFVAPEFPRIGNIRLEFVT